jgi:hypothetical protein
VKDGAVYLVVLDFDIIRDGTAETEMRSMVSALEIALPGGLHEKADILRAVSGTTDHADAATKSMVLFGGENQKVWGDTSSEEKMQLSAQDKKLERNLTSATLRRTWLISSLRIMLKAGHGVNKLAITLTNWRQHTGRWIFTSNHGCVRRTFSGVISIYFPIIQ